LEEIKAHKKPILLVFNKIDKLKEPLRLPDEIEEGEEDIPYIERLKNTWMAKENAPAIFISATQKTNVQELKDAVIELVRKHNKVGYFK
jgi:GTP-binding protein HflX